MPEKQKRRRKSASQGSDTGGCITDGCFYLSFDGCVDFDGGCIDLPGDGCNAFDGCSMGCISFPLRIIVILGLMMYGDYPVTTPKNEQ